jgi:hypothetical protein
MPITSGPIDYNAPTLHFLRLGSTDISGIMDEIHEWLYTFWRRPDYLVISTRQLDFIELELDPTGRFHTSKSIRQFTYPSPPDEGNKKTSDS